MVLFDWANSNGFICVKMNGSVLEEKSCFKMLGLIFSSKFNWGSYIISIAKTASKEIGAFIRSVKFLSPQVAPYLCKSTIHPCIRLRHMKNKGVRQSHVSSLTSEAIDM